MSVFGVYSIIFFTSMLNALTHLCSAGPYGIPANCDEVYRSSSGQAVQNSLSININPSGEAFVVECEAASDMPTRPWTIIQRRTGPELDFYRNWTEYKNGFGCPFKNYWLGLNYINQLIKYNQNNYNPTTLRIELTDWSGVSCYAQYDNFKINDESDKYRLSSLGNFQGTCGDSLIYHLNMQFSTYDNDNDLVASSCADQYHAAFWYNTCLWANPNGPYAAGSSVAIGQGITWRSGKGHNYSYKSSVMKILMGYPMAT